MKSLHASLPSPPLPPTATQRFRNVETLKGHQIGPEACRYLAQLVGQNVCPRLSRLDLGWNMVRRLGGDSLVRAFSQAGAQCRLEELDLRMNHLPPSTIIDLGRALRERGCLSFMRVLDLRQNMIGSEGAKAIAHTVLAGGFTTLERLYVQHNQVRWSAATSYCLVPALQNLRVQAFRIYC